MPIKKRLKASPLRKISKYPRRFTVRVSEKKYSEVIRKSKKMKKSCAEYIRYMIGD